EGPLALAQRVAQCRRDDLRAEPRESADPAGAREVRADGVRADPRDHDDLPPARHPAGAAPYPRVRRRRRPAPVSAAGMTTLLEAKGVSKRFGGLTALNALDFELQEAAIASIIGPNGAGKTTFFNVFTGIYTPEEGVVTFRGTPILGKRPDQITELGICRTFQNIRLFGNMTAAENVLVGMHCRVPV